jgi:hypothetical protein
MKQSWKPLLATVQTVCHHCVAIYCCFSHVLQGDSGGICITLGNDSMSDSKQKNSYEHGSDFERLRSYGHI